MEGLPGDSSHSDNKHLDIPASLQSELFNDAHPNDLGITKFATMSCDDNVKLLGMYKSGMHLDAPDAIEGWNGYLAPTCQNFVQKTSESFLRKITLCPPALRN